MKNVVQVAINEKSNNNKKDSFDISFINYSFYVAVTSICNKFI